MIINGFVLTKNSNDNYINLVIKNENGILYNVKTSNEIADELIKNHVYQFNVTEKNGVRNSLKLESYVDVSKINSHEREEILRLFVPHSHNNFDENKKILYEYIEEIDNTILKNITVKLVDKYLVDFLTYPGGTKIHHSYLGGLISHTIGMLKLAKSLIQIYPFLDKNYLFSGIILHDLGKIFEYNDVQNTEFDLPGQLLGHLVIGTMEIEKIALELGYSNTEEVMILEHIIISHHGQLQYGSAKRPITAEALMIYFLDNIDSKFSVLGDILAQTDSGSFTDSIPVLEKMKFYKPKK